MQRVIPLSVEGVRVQIKLLHFRVGGDHSGAWETSAKDSTRVGELVRSGVATGSTWVCD